MQALSQQFQVQNLTNVAEHIAAKCYSACVKVPDSKLSSSEQKCVQLCTEKYLDARRLIANELMQKVQNAEK